MQFGHAPGLRHAAVREQVLEGGREFRRNGGAGQDGKADGPRSSPSNNRCCMQPAICPGAPKSTVGFVSRMASMQPSGVNIGRIQAEAPTASASCSV